MKKINVSEATNTQLNWLVAKCEGYDVGFDSYGVMIHRHQVTDRFDPTVNAGWMWPIIEREGIGLESEARDHSIWKARFRFTKQIWFRNPMRQIHTYCSMQGPTSLIAAARCYVVSKLGDVVEVPEELP